MIKINIKPFSINKAFQGKRFKTQDYKIYEQELFYLLPKLKIPKGNLEVNLEFGLSSKIADLDNPVKVTIDIFQKKYEFNDKLIMYMTLHKVIVKKGKEYIKFNIKSYE